MNLIPLLIKFYVSLVELLLFFSLAIILIHFVYYNDIHTHSLNQEDVNDMVEKFLEYVMTNHHVNEEPETILQAFQISLVRNVSLICFFLGIFFFPSIILAAPSSVCFWKYMSFSERNLSNGVFVYEY